MNHKIPNFLIVLISFAFILNSCGPFDYTEKADYSNKRFENSGLYGNITVDEVIDSRTNTESSENINQDFISIISRGYFTYKYNFDDPLEEFVKKSIEASINNSDEFENLIVTVIIDTLKIEDDNTFFGKHAKIDCALNFIYTDQSGEENIVKTSFNDFLSSPFDTFDDVKYLIYDGIYNCTAQFINSLNNTPEIAAYEELDIKSEELEDFYDYKDFEFLETNFNYNSSFDQGFGMAYHLGYFRGEPNSHIMNGFILDIGYYLDEQNYSYYNITRYYGLGYSPYYFFNKKHNGFFFNPIIELEIALKPGFNQENVLFRPVIKEMVGIKLGHFLIKAGVYQILKTDTDFSNQDYGFEVGASLLYY